MPTLSSKLMDVRLLELVPLGHDGPLKCEFTMICVAEKPLRHHSRQDPARWWRDSTLAAVSSLSMSQPPWHNNVLGNATDALLLVASLLVTFCVLSGKWWVMGYALMAVVVYVLVLLYVLYLEHTAQDFLEKQYKARSARPKPRRPDFVAS